MKKCYSPFYDVFKDKSKFHVITVFYLVYPRFVLIVGWFIEYQLIYDYKMSLLVWFMIKGGEWGFNLDRILTGHGHDFGQILFFPFCC